MINIADLPAVRGQLELDAAAKQSPAPAESAAPQYARAPAAAGPQQTDGRPPAAQRSAR